jgi:hypothetical protein
MIAISINTSLAYKEHCNSSFTFETDLLLACNSDNKLICLYSSKNRDHYYMVEHPKVFENGKNVSAGSSTYRIGESTGTTIEFTRDRIFVKKILPSYAITKSREYIIDLKNFDAIEKVVSRFQSKATTEEDYFQCEIDLGSSY